MEKIQVGLFVGSLRKESFNKKIAKHLISITPEGYEYKIIEMFFRTSQAQAEVDSELQLKLQRQAHTCGNALLAPVFLSCVIVYLSVLL